MGVTWDLGGIHPPDGKDCLGRCPRLYVYADGFPPENDGS